jgi:hypothetical protein
LRNHRCTVEANLPASLGAAMAASSSGYQQPRFNHSGITGRKRPSGC